MIRVVGAVALLTGALATSAAARPGDVVIALISATTSVKAHDSPPKGKSKGDSVDMDDRLANAVKQFGKPKGTFVGSDHAIERIGAGGVATVEGVAKLPDGTVRFRGRLRADAQGSATVPVVGGTGRYEGARGTVTITDLPQRGLALNVYRLILLPVG